MAKEKNIIDMKLRTRYCDKEYGVLILRPIPIVPGFRDF